MTDEDWMRLALAEAEEAHARGDWPTGAVLVKGGALLARGQNRQVSQGDPLLHAEPEALRLACAAHGPDAARGATLYCTMEPCPMCAGALQLAGVATLVLALRHARLRRSDLGSYSVERFCALTGHAMALRDGVLEADYLALRLRWGRDQVHQQP
ncbi:MAG TPA: nucleoside deaminase [Pseudorhodoferax sp.]|nr:nucleoside deaminase [Pseudorhodoferax sp.]